MPGSDIVRELPAASVVGASQGSSAGLAGAGIAAGANLVTSLLNNFLASSAEDDRREYNFKMWKLQNEYNSPLEQVKRLKAAGLNPALMYGGGSTSPGLAGAVPSAEQPLRQPLPTIDPLTASQIELNKSQARKNDSDAKLTNTERAIRDLDYFIMDSTREQMLAAAKSELAAAHVESVDQFYQAVYSASLIASLFKDMPSGALKDRDGNVLFNVPLGIRNRFRELGLGDLEQKRLEQQLYKSYKDAQEKINAAAGEEAEVDAVLPQLINDAPDWLKPILVIVKSWLVDGKMPSMVFSPHRTVVTSSHYSDDKHYHFRHR